MKTLGIKPPLRPSKCPACKLDFEVSLPFCRQCGLDLDYGTPTRVANGQCIYCGTDCRFSREHVYGKWIKGRFGSRFTSVTHTLSRPELFVDVWTPTAIHTRSERHPGGLYDQVVLNVCEGCNNGWMSQLHVAASPLVTELATATWRIFSPEDLKLLTRWIAMVTINLQCRARQLTSTEHQRRQLFDGDVPSGWRVYAGTMLDDRHGGKHFNRAMATAIEMGDGAFLPLTSCYFVIERAAFFSFSSIGDFTLEAALMSSGANGRDMPLRQLHPSVSDTEGTSWMFLSLEQLDAIQAWFGAVDPLPSQ